MYYAEFETDKYIRENFFPDFSQKKIMVEVGAGPTEYFSMSKHFRDSGWRCICIDPNPKYVNEHKKMRHEIYQVACSYEEKESTFKIVETSWSDGLSFSAIDVKYTLPEVHKIEEIKVKVTKLDTLLNNLNINNVDLVSVDTEGWEIEVMKGFDVKKYQPKVVVLENYLHSEDYVPYMESIGYNLLNKIQYNYIFCKNNE